jgi:replicative DNA helicase
MAIRSKPMSITKLKETVPHSVDAEKALLASAMQHHETAVEIFGKVHPEDLFVPAHKTIYERMIKDWKNGVTFDLIAFTERLSDDKVLLEIGGAQEITAIYNFVPTHLNFKQYLEIVLEKAMGRKIIKLSLDTAEKIAKDPETVKSTLLELQAESRLIKPYEDKPPRSLKDDIDDKIERMSNGQSDKDIIMTGLAKLDHLSPLKKGDFPVITGPTKSGKSIFALSILVNTCIKRDISGLYFSLESPRSEVIDRIFAGVSRIPMDKHDAKHFTESEMTRAQKAALAIGASNLIIYDDKFELLDIIATIQSTYIHNPNLGIIVVDYCQLVTAPLKKGATREQEVALISRTLRLLAMEIKVPIIMLSQENEEGRSRESRAIEQDTTAKWQIDMDEFEPHIRTIRIPLQRNGQSGISFDVTFYGNLARMENHAEENQAAPEGA